MKAFRWANAWRGAYQEAERALFKDPEIRAGMVEGSVFGDEGTVYVVSS
jgi:hypothetical protein